MSANSNNNWVELITADDNFLLTFINGKVNSREMCESRMNNRMRYEKNITYHAAESVRPL